MTEQRPQPAAGEIRLRHGGAGDLDVVMRIMRTAFPACYGEAWTRSQCAGILPMSGVELVLAEQGSATTGFALMRVIADEAELLLLAVEPAAQGRGVGRAMLNHFVAAARASGATRLHLEVRDGNPAVLLYKEAGFATAGRRPAYYKGPAGDLHDALTLVLAD